MAGFWGRLRGAFSVLSGETDVTQLEQDAAKSQRQLRRQAGTVNFLKGVVESYQKKEVETAKKMRSRFAEVESEGNPSADLDKMVAKILDAELTGKPRLGLHPMDVRVLLFEDGVDLSYGKRVWGRTYGVGDHFLGLKESLPLVCVKNSDQSWAKPVLLDTIRAIGASGYSPADEVLPSFVKLWQEKNTSEEKFAFYSLLDAALSKMTAKDVSSFLRSSWRVDECPPEFFLLLEKHKLVTADLKKKLLKEDVTPNQNRLTGKGGLVHRSIMLSPEFLLGQQRDRYRDLTENTHDQIELAKTPEERERILDRAGSDYKCKVKLFKLMTGEDLWPKSKSSNGKSQPEKVGNTLDLMKSLDQSTSDTSSYQVFVSNHENKNTRSGKSRSGRSE